MEWRSNVQKRSPNTTLEAKECNILRWHSTLKSAENRPNKQYAVVESCPEVDGAVYRSGVYKILMARMWLTTTDKNPNESVKKKER